MSDPLNRDLLSDDQFRNRIAAALRELDRPESDADLAAALDSVDAEPLSPAAQRRIMQQVRRTMVASREAATAIPGQPSQPGHADHPGQPAHTARTAPSPTAGAASRPGSARWGSSIGIVSACAAVLAVVGVVISRFNGVDRTPLRTDALLSSTDRTRPAVAAPTPAVMLGETISTGPREKRRVTMPDGSVLSINEQSRVAIIGRRRVKLMAGELFVEVLPAPASERFVVETPRRTVTALGTKFVVKAQGRATNVVVTQGKVQVSGVDEVIPAGRELIADLTESKSVELRPAKRSAYVVEWVKDLMASVGSVVVPASEHAGGSVTVVDPNGQEMKLSLRKFHVDVHIEDGFARTTIDQTYFNHTWQQLEGTFRFPLPADASLSRLAMYVNGRLMEGGMVERDYGRNVFEQIRHTRRDPALLEWVDGSTFQMRVFPLEPRQEKRIVLSYTQRLPNDYGRSVYRFPAGHSLDGVREWSTHLRVKGAAGTKWYSPSHLLNGREEHGDLLIDGRDEYAELDRDLVVEFTEPAGAGFGSGTAVGGGPTRSPAEGAATWSLCEQDGFQYVMLRQRPELKGDAKHEPRQWVFLVENSADRNDVLAETQRQIAKVLLDNAEHTDTFSVIRAGTQAESFQRNPVECSIENLAAAQQFLKEVAPIGALDLEQAWRAVQKQVRSGRDVWIVHLGTGIPVLGERDNNALLRLLPVHARYVGVAVGKRWSKSFMETAASHSGGHIAQINPDEVVSWRAFDLLSTLNAPRLTEIAIQVPQSQNASVRDRSSDAGSAGASPSPFLLLTKSLAHGQELTAVARFAKGEPLPKSVTITGKLNGKPYSQEVTAPLSVIVPGVARLVTGTVHDGNHGHLPRTWARLEIDRLVALGATEHKPQIIELSKSMYVMSPFTSLLVLETEAMYEQFKVDRGRKDHWAMYPAPAEIPVVADPGPRQLSPLDAAKERLKLSQTRAKTAQANYERSLAEKRPATDLQRLDRRMRTEQTEVRLIEREVQRIERANAAAADPVRIAWESVVQRRSVWQQVYYHASPNQWTYWNRPNVWDDWSERGIPTVDDFGLQSMEGVPTVFTSISPVDRIVRRRWNSSQLMPWAGNSTLIRRTYLDIVGNLPSATRSAGEMQGLMEFEGFFTPGTSNLGLSAFGDERDFRVKKLASVNDLVFGANVNGGSLPLPMLVLSDSRAVEFEGFGGQQMSFVGTMPLPQVLTVPRYTVPIGEFSFDTSLIGEGWSRRSIRLPHSGPVIGNPLSLRSFNGNGIVDDVNGDFDNDGDGIPESIWNGLDVPPSHGLIRLVQPGLGGGRYVNGFNGTIVSPDGNQLIFTGNRWSTADGLMLDYVDSPSAYSVHSLAGVLKDLPGYAPGLQTWRADRLAIVEQASPTKPRNGDVDPEARRLIEKARSLGWEKVTHTFNRHANGVRANGDPAPAPPTHADGVGVKQEGDFVLADGSGRFIFNREVGEGLKEQVIHDGSTLWHLYPEIGLGAKRAVSRFHQPAIQSLIPWYVPSADDLSIDADLQAVGELTVRITRRMGTPARPQIAEGQKADEGQRADEGQQKNETDGEESPPHEIAFELVFGEDGRLVETRIVDVTANKRLARQSFSADGTIRLFDAEDKLITEVKYERQPVEAPDLVPATKDLVVLPLPYRTLSGVPVSVPVNLQTNAPDFAKLSDDDALMLLATYFAEARPNELAAFIDQRYSSKGDHRIGLAVLLSAVAPHSPLVAKATGQHPNSPLARYLEQFAASGQFTRTMNPIEGASPFLRRLIATYNVQFHWSGTQVATRVQTMEETDKDVDAGLLVVHDCRSVEVAAKLLSMISHGLTQSNRMTARLARKLNATAAAVADEHGLPAFARTARIDWLLTAGDDASVDQAKKLFQAQLVDAVEVGAVPDLGGTTRGAFVRHFKTPDGQPCQAWGELVDGAARKLAEKKQPRKLIALARGCVAMGEPVLAAGIFKLAVQDQDLASNQPLNLAALAYAKEAGDWELAEACVGRALADANLQQIPQLWRDAANAEHHLRKFKEWIESLDRAYEIEFVALPKRVNLEAFRRDYDSLFTQLEERAEQLADDNLLARLSFARVVQRAATRWRDIDVNDTAACHRTAKILTKLGFATAAWNYWTTPLAETPDQPGVWLSFASAMQSQQRSADADRAWTIAFDCEPTNPDILLMHSQFLQSTGQEEKARELLAKIINGTWQPRFENTKQQARMLLGKADQSK
jgi:ferric-dicitrate binding protein FerR (iron transport regulator)